LEPFSDGRQAPLSSALAANDYRRAAPFFIMVSLIQIFGRIAWHSAQMEAHRLARFWGFLRWNTSVFNLLNALPFGIELVGSITVAAAGANADIVRGGEAVIKSGLFVQLIVFVASAVIVWRFGLVSQDWEAEWGEELKHWTWKKLLNVVLASVVLISVNSRSRRWSNPC
jgi:RTA1 like protein